MKSLSEIQKLTLSAVFMALYIAIMFYTQSFAFGQYQIRIATALYGLSALFPFLMVPLALANMLSNLLLGGLGLLDMLGGGVVGLLTSAAIIYAKRMGCGNWCIFAAVTLIPGLLVPVWLAVILAIPYAALVVSVLVGQCVCGVVSMLTVTALERNTAVKPAMERR